jgi:hypothetical protein
MARMRWVCAVLATLVAGGCDHANEPPPETPREAVSTPAKSAPEPAVVEPPAEPEPPAPDLEQPLNLATVDAMLGAIVGEGRGLSAAQFLLRLGFDADALESLASADVNDARRIEDNLDSDPELENVIIVDAVLRGANPNAPGRQVFVVWAEAGPPFTTAGRMHFLADSCAVEASIDVAIRPIHTAAFADTVIAVESSVDCAANLRASHRTLVVTLARGKAETLLDVTDESERDRASGKIVDPALTLSFKGKPPQIAELVDDTRRPRKRFTFDAKAFRYR